AGFPCNPYIMHALYLTRTTNWTIKYETPVDGKSFGERSEFCPLRDRRRGNRRGMRPGRSTTRLAHFASGRRRLCGGCLERFDQARAWWCEIPRTGGQELEPRRISHG